MQAAQTSTNSHRRPWDMQRFIPVLLVVPMVLGLLVFAIYPLVYLLILSSSKSLLGKPFQAWVGFDNYREALTDQPFLASLLRSVAFAFPVTVVELILGLTI